MSNHTDIDLVVNNPLADHLGLKRAFRPGAMTIGLIAPLEGFDGPVPTISNHIELIQ